MARSYRQQCDSGANTSTNTAADTANRPSASAMFDFEALDVEDLSLAASDGPAGTAPGTTGTAAGTAADAVGLASVLDFCEVFGNDDEAHTATGSGVAASTKPQQTVPTLNIDEESDCAQPSIFVEFAAAASQAVPAAAADAMSTTTRRVR